MKNISISNKVIFEAYKLYGYKEKSRALVGVSLKNVKFARDVDEVINEIKEDIAKYIYRKNPEHRLAINRAFRILIGNFVYSFFERKPLAIPNKSSAFNAGTRLAKIFLARRATRAVIDGLKAKDYIKLHTNGSKNNQLVGTYVATEKLEKFLIPLLYCVVEEYVDDNFKDYVKFNEESKKEKQRRIKKDNKSKELGINNLIDSSYIVSDTRGTSNASLSDDHPDLVNLRKVNNYLKDVTYALKSPIKLIYTKDFLHGGRLYTPIQNLPMRKAEVRINTLINGKPVVEIDFSASFARIAAALHGKELPEDPYSEVASRAGVTRGQVKFLFTRAFGAKDRRISLTDEEEPLNSINVEQRVTIEKITKEIFPEVFPAFYNKKEPSGSLFQAIEGQVLLKTMARLSEVNVPALPVHDSLMVPKKDFGIAEKLLKNYWREVLNVNFDPVLKVEKP